MRAAHGTPEEFERAVTIAAAELTVSEANAAIDGYRAEYESMPESTCSAASTTTPTPTRKPYEPPRVVASYELPSVDHPATDLLKDPHGIVVAVELAERARTNQRLRDRAESQAASESKSAAVRATDVELAAQARVSRYLRDRAKTMIRRIASLTDSAIADAQRIKALALVEAAAMIDDGIARERVLPPNESFVRICVEYEEGWEDDERVQVGAFSITGLDGLRDPEERGPRIAIERRGARLTLPWFRLEGYAGRPSNLARIVMERAAPLVEELMSETLEELMSETREEREDRRGNKPEGGGGT